MTTETDKKENTIDEESMVRMLVSTGKDPRDARRMVAEFIAEHEGKKDGEDDQDKVRSEARAT